VHPSQISPMNKPILVSRRAEDSRILFPNAEERSLFPLCKDTRTTISIYRGFGKSSINEIELIGVLTFSRLRCVGPELCCSRARLRSNDPLIHPSAEGFSQEYRTFTMI